MSKDLKPIRCACGKLIAMSDEKGKVYVQCKSCKKQVKIGAREKPPDKTK